MVTIPELALLMAPREGGNTTLIFGVQMMLIFAIFYFLLIRPQSKERQRHEAMLGGIKKGDEIVTNGGIIGKVVHIEEHRLTLRTSDNTRVTVDRGRIASVIQALVPFKKPSGSWPSPPKPAQKTMRRNEKKVSQVARVNHRHQS